MRLSLAAALLLAGVGVSTARAQTLLSSPAPPPPPGPGDFTTLPVTPLPHVYASAVTATVEAGNRITGSFTVRNSEETLVTGLAADLLILGPRPPPAAPGEFTFDTAPTFDWITVPETFSLRPKEEKVLPLAYTAPPLPDGEYRLRVQLRLPNDRRLGWGDTDLRLGGSDAFLVIIGGVVLTDGYDPLERASKARWWPREGPNVTGGQPVTLSARVRQAGTRALTVTPLLTAQRILAPDQPVRTERGPSVTVQPGEERDIEVLTQAPSEPGAYRLLLSFTEGPARVSGLLEYRVVVRGPTASLGRVEVRSLPTVPGEPAVIRFGVWGSADRETATDAVARVEVLDGTRVLGSATQPVALAFGEGQNSAFEGTARVPLRGPPCGQPRLRVTLSGRDGTILDRHESDLPTDQQTPCPAGGLTTRPAVLLTALLLVLLALLVAAVILRRRQSVVPRLPILLAATATAAVLAWASSTQPAQAGIQIIEMYPSWWGQNSYLFVNQPQHDATLPSGTFVYEARMGAGYCINDAISMNLRGYLLQGSGKIHPSNNSQHRWTQVAAGTGGHNVGSCGGRNCQLWADTFRASVTVPLPHPHPPNTTLWTRGEWHRAWGTNIIHDNTWVNFAVCSPQPTSGGQCLTPDGPPRVAWSACTNPAPSSYTAQFFLPGSPRVLAEATVNHPTSSVEVPPVVYSSRPDRQYEYQVIARSGTQDLGTSPRATFAIGKPPTAPSLLAPLGTVITGSPLTFRWQYVIPDLVKNRIGSVILAFASATRPGVPESPGSSVYTHSPPFTAPVTSGAHNATITTNHPIPACGSNVTSFPVTVVSPTPTPTPSAPPSLPGGQFQEKP